MLLIGYTLNFLDRQLMTILLEPIKAEFGVSDTAMGFLTGFAFAIFYATLGVPVARLADRWSRRNVLAGAMVIWSLMTALCGMAASFWQLVLVRIGVGVGEAGGTPPSHALIAAYFPVAQRSTAMGVYASGAQIGVLIGMFGGALIAEHLGWRWAFFIFSLPGVLLGLLVMLTIREPLSPVQPEASAPTKSSSMARDVLTLWRLPAFGIVALATGCTALAGYGMGAWLPSFLIRVHGLSLVEAGLILGVVGTLGALVGAVTGGLLCDRLAARDARWQLWIPAIGAGLSMVFLGTALLWPEAQHWVLADFQIPVATVFLFFGGVFSLFWVGPVTAIVQTITPEHLRAQASALLLLLFNLIGMGLGPLLVGILSDALTPDLGPEAIRYAMLISLVTVLIGAAGYCRAAPLYRAGARSRVE